MARSFPVHNAFLSSILSASFIWGLVLGTALTGCAYSWGPGERAIPGGYKQVFIPVFKNYSMEPGIEVDFTNSLRLEFERSKVARLAGPETSEAEVLGEIMSVHYNPLVPNVGGTLPTGTVLASQYEIVLQVKVTLRRRSDLKVLWTSTFDNSRNYLAPQVTMAGVNSVDPLYNLSSRRQNIQQMSQNLMSQAYDRLSENF